MGAPTGSGTVTTRGDRPAAPLRGAVPAWRPAQFSRRGLPDLRAVNTRWLAALGGVHVLLGGVLGAVFQRELGFWWHAGTHAALLAPLLLVGLPLVRERNLGISPRRVLQLVLVAGLASRAPPRRRAPPPRRPTSTG